MQPQPEVKSLKVPQEVTGYWDLFIERLKNLESDVHKSQQLQKCRPARTQQ